MTEKGRPTTAARDLYEQLMDCRKRLESIERLRYHSARDAVLLARQYRAALAVLPGHLSSAGSYNNLGWALQKLGRLDEAIEAYSHAIWLGPQLELAPNNLIAAQKAKGQ